jgi:WD40 repeat protein/tetratricopeptide (TPR) repeat protein/tRNA A-37 threonylcarbamoyl transferase component Bud32
VTASGERPLAPPFPEAKTGALAAESSPQRFGDYELLSEIAQGGMGVVYKARQLSLNRTVAVKMIRSGIFASKEFVHRFRVEASAAAVLQHPNIVAVHEVGLHEGQHFFSMDYVPGQNLAQIVRDGPLPADRAARYVQKIAEAIHYAHQSGILHRDLKPSNVLIDANDQPRITDFGLAKQLNSESSATLTGEVMGTPGYMPPEQASGNRGAVKAWSDVYSLGAILYHLVSGRAPFAAGSLEETLNQVLNQDPVSLRLLNPSVPRDLDTICLKCLEKEPAKRYHSAQLLAEELTRFLNHEPILARSIGAVGRAVRWCRRKPALAGTGAVALLAVMLGFVGVFWQWRNSESHRKTSENTVSRLEIERAEMLFADGKSAEALAYLARVVRREATNRVAGERLLSALAQRNFCVPLFRLEHLGTVMSAEFSPDGQRILTASKDGRARVWDAQSGQALLTLPHAGEVMAAHFSADGMRLVSVSLDKTARIWDAHTGRPIIEPLEHTSGVLCAEFSPDEQRLATGTGDGSLTLWDVTTGKPSGQSAQIKGELEYLEFSPDGRQLVLASQRSRRGQVINVTDAKTLVEFIQYENMDYNIAVNVNYPSFSPDGARVVTVPPGGNLSVIPTGFDSTNRLLGQLHTHSITCARFSPDGQSLATAATDSNARIWDAHTLQPVSEVMRHDNYVNCIQFSPDGHAVATGSRDYTVRIWNAQSGRPLCEPLRHDANVLSIQFSRDGRRILSLLEGTTVCVWEVRSGQPLAASLPHPSEVRRALFSSDGKRIATSSDARLRLWDVRRAAPLLPPFGAGNADRDLQFGAKDAQLLAVGNPPIGGGEARMSVFESATGKQVAGPFRSPLPGNETQCGRFSPDGEFVLLGGYSHQVRVWRVATGQLISELGHEAPVGYAQFSPDGRWVVTTSVDKTARLWDWRTGRPLTEPLRHGGAVVWADVSADSRQVVTIARDQIARIWDARSGQLLHRLPHSGEPYAFHAVQFSPDGRRVVTASGNAAQVWDAHSGQTVTSPLQHDGRVNSVRFSPEGRRIITACNDGSGRIWDATTGHLLAEPMSHHARVIYAEFSPDGCWAVTASTDGMARIWEVAALSSSVSPWLADWAEAVGGQRLDARGATQSVGFEERLRVRKQIDRGTDGDETARWAKWFFAEQTARNVSPASLISLPQFVEQCVTAHTLPSLEQAVRLSPSHALAQARWALAMVTNQATVHPRLMAQCEWQSVRAAELAPNEPEVWRARAQLLEHAGKLTNALDCMNQVISLNATNAAFWDGKGLLLEKVNRRDEALQAYTAAIQLSGPWKDTLSYPAIALVNRSRLHLGEKRFAQAVEDNLAAANVPARGQEVSPALLDLSIHYSAGLAYNFAHTEGHNYLSAGLTPGQHTLHGTVFDLRGFVALRIPSGPSRSVRSPERINHIGVNQTCQRLHFLHTVAGGVSPEGIQVATFVIHRRDGQSKEVPVRYGEHVRFFDQDEDSRETLASDSALVWLGTNAATFPVRLFRTTWTNTEPEVSVESIDFTSAKTRSQPLLFAITAEP